MATYLIGNVKGPKGEDGYSPKASVQQTSNGAIISIQDADGITTAEIRNGIDADGNIIDLSPYATKVEVEGQIDALADTYSTIDYVDDEIAKVQAPVTSVNGMVGDVVINQPDLTGYATTTWVTGQGYLTEAPVATVNGQAGTVVLDAEDVGALPDDTVIPTNVSDLTNDSGFLNATTLAPYLAGKQDTITAGANITIQNNVISASGGSNFSGDYDDLTNKPDLSVYAETADLATVATSGSYTDLSDKPTIPTYTAGDNIDITNNVISVPDIEFVDGSSNPNLSGVDAVARIDAHELYTGLEANGTEVGYFRINPEEGGIFGGSTFYNKEQSWTPNGVSFTDTNLNKTVTLAPNSKFTNLTIGGDDVVTVGELRPYATKTELAAKQDALPALTNNAGKVLTVNSGATGVEWAEASGGGASYTAGDGIVIDNNEISVDTDIVATKIMEDDHDGTQEYASLELDFGGIASVWNNADGDYVNGSWLSSTEIGIDHMTYDQVEQDWVTDSSTVIMPNSITLNDGDGEAIISKHRGLDLMVSDGVDSKTIAYVEDLPSGGGSDTLVINGQQWNATTLAPLIERYQDEQTAYSSITQVEGNGKTANWRLMEIASSSSTSLYIFYVRDNYYYNWNDSSRIDVLKITLNPSDNYSFTNATVRNITIPFDASQLWSGLNASTAPSGTSGKTTAYELTYIKNNYATKTELAAKQDTLTAGTGISISNNVISATGGGSGGSTAEGLVYYYDGLNTDSLAADTTFTAKLSSYATMPAMLIPSASNTSAKTVFVLYDAFEGSYVKYRSVPIEGSDGYAYTEWSFTYDSGNSVWEVGNNSVYSGYRIQSPNGTEYKITVDNNGNLSAVAA